MIIPIEAVAVVGSGPSGGYWSRWAVFLVAVVNGG